MRAWKRESEGREEGRGSEKAREKERARERASERSRKGSPHISKRQSKLRVTCFTSTTVQILTQKRGTLDPRGLDHALYRRPRASCVARAGVLSQNVRGY